MKLKFDKQGDDNIWFINEDGKDTDKIKFENLGFIFIDELGINWNIAEEYSGIIELEELKQIVEFMEKRSVSIGSKS